MCSGALWVLYSREIVDEWWVAKGVLQRWKWGSVVGDGG